MFQSIKYVRFLGLNSTLNQYEYEFELTDSEFGTVKNPSTFGYGGGGALAGELVIKTYEGKGLPVPENFAHYIRYINREHGKYGYTKQWMLDWHSANNKLFHKYKDEVLKALDKLEAAEKANTCKLKDVPIGTEVSLNGYSENPTVIGHYGNGATVLAWKANPNKKFHWELRGSSVMALEHKAHVKNSTKFLKDTSQFKYAFIASGDRDCQIAAEPKAQPIEEKVALKDLPMGSEVMIDEEKAKIVGKHATYGTFLLAFEKLPERARADRRQHVWPDPAVIGRDESFSYTDDDLSAYNHLQWFADYKTVAPVKKASPEAKLFPKPTEYLPLKDVPIGSEIEWSFGPEKGPATIIGRTPAGSTFLGTNAKELRSGWYSSDVADRYSHSSDVYLDSPLSHERYSLVSHPENSGRKFKVLNKPTAPVKTTSKFPTQVKQVKPTFKSIEYIGFNGHNETTKQREYNYKIVDEGFEWIATDASISSVSDATGAAIISCYEEKGLSVPENFAAYFQYLVKTLGHTIDWLIDHHSAHNTKFAKYKDEVLKILGKTPAQQAPLATEQAKSMKLIDVPVGSEIELDGVKATIIARNLTYKSTLLAWKTKTEAPSASSHPWFHISVFSGKIPADNKHDTYARIANEDEWNNAVGIWDYEPGRYVKAIRLDSSAAASLSGPITTQSIKQAQQALSDLYKGTMNDEIKAQTQSVKEASETIKTATRSIEEIAKTLREKKTEEAVEKAFSKVNEAVSKVLGTDAADKAMSPLTADELKTLSIADLGKSPFQSARSPAKVAGSSSIGEEILKGLANQQAAASLKAQVEKAMKAVEDLEAQAKEREKTITKRTIAATKLAMQMQKTGLIQDYEFERQVENILTWNDHAFQMMKKTVEKLTVAPPATQITVIDGRSVSELKQATSKVEEAIKPTFTDTLKSEVKDAGFRVAAIKLTSAVKAGILALLKSKGLDGGKIQTFSELLDTEIGGAFISELLGHGLPYIPHVKNDPRIQRLAEEFRIGGYTPIGSAVIDGLMEYILPAISSSLKELPADEGEKVRVVEPTQSSQEEKSSDSIHDDGLDMQLLESVQLEQEQIELEQEKLEQVI